MDTKLSYCLSILTILLTLSGCSQSGTGNIIKVLDRVNCDPSEDYCPQDKINDIWDYCLQNGFQESLGGKTVTSSRNITELVQGTIEKTGTITETKEIHSDTGIVYNDTEEKVGTVSRDIKGYCIGSEYITK